jgi:6-phosphogluconolactonase/glucosamine-6-phosphate isomerase/deaminase
LVQESHQPKKDGVPRGGAYSLEPAAVAPDLPGSVVLRTDADDALDALLEDLVGHALACVREFGDFHLAASGDPQFEPLFIRMMIDPRFRAMPWKRTHLWLLHEEANPDAPSAFARIQDAIIEHSDIPPEQAHEIDLLARDPVADYERRIRAALEWREPGQDRLDAVVLAPMQRGLSEAPDADRLVFSTRCPDTGHPLIALTPAFLRSARLISVLATGEASRAHVREVAGTTPALAWTLMPVAGELRWYIDPDAVA